MWHMPNMRFAALILTGTLTAHPLLAGTFCDALFRNDASLGQDDAKCSINLLQGGISQMSCHWDFSYRSTESLLRFEDIQAEIENCLGTDAALPADTQVNHPDSFELRQYEGQGARVALSLKDKAGLDQTLVFLSISAIP